LILVPAERGGARALDDVASLRGLDDWRGKSHELPRLTGVKCVPMGETALPSSVESEGVPVPWARGGATVCVAWPRVGAVEPLRVARGAEVKSLSWTRGVVPLPLACGDALVPLTRGGVTVPSPWARGFLRMPVPPVKKDCGDVSVSSLPGCAPRSGLNERERVRVRPMLLAVSLDWAAEGALRRSSWSAWALILVPAERGGARALDDVASLRGLDDWRGENHELPRLTCSKCVPEGETAWPPLVEREISQPCSRSVEWLTRLAACLEVRR
jgi:hypothetical protein